MNIFNETPDGVHIGAAVTMSETEEYLISLLMNTVGKSQVIRACLKCIRFFAVDQIRNGAIMKGEGKVEMLLIVVSILECLCFSGLPFGWTSLVYISKSERYFAELCSNSNLTNASTEGVCLQQDERLNLIYSTGLAFIFVSIMYVGFIIKSIGEFKTRILHMYMFTSGALFLAFATADSPWLLLPGLMLVGTGGFVSLSTNYRVVTLLQRGSSVYICLLNGSFDSSAVIFLLVKILYDNGISLKYSFIGIAVLYIVLSGFCTILQYWTIDRKNHENNKTESTELGDVDSNIRDTSKTTEHRGGVQEWFKYICCVDNRMVLMWSSFNVLNFVFYIGSFNSKLESELQILDDVNHYTNVLGYVMTAGIMSSFPVGLFHEWQKWIFSDSPSNTRQRLLPLVAPLCVTSILGILLRALSFTTTTRWTLYTSFAVILFYRAFIFSVHANYVVTVFPQQYVTLIIAINQSIFGLFSLVQYPLFRWRDLYQGADKHVSILLITLSLLSILHAGRTCLKALRN